MKEKINEILQKIINYIKNNKLFLIFVISSVANSTLLRFFTVKNYLEIKPILADLGAVILIGAFGFLFKPKNRFKYYFAWSIFFTFLCVVNSMYYTNFMSYASISLLSTVSQVVDVSDAVVNNVMEIKDFSYIWQVVAMIFVNVYLKRTNYKEEDEEKTTRKVKTINAVVVSLICYGFFISTLTSLDYSRFGKQWNRTYLVMKFGLYTYQSNDIFVSLKTKISPLFGYDEAAKEFRKFYEEKAQQKHEDNQYTKIFEGKNILTIHAESIQNYTLNTSFNGQDLTPNLKRLAQEGLYFSNFYAQESVGTSSDTEFTLLTSLMPANSGTVAISYWDREYNTILKELKKKDYYTFSMHANNGTFWNRNLIHPKYGYNDFFYYTKDYEIDEVLGLGLSDKSFFRQSVPKIKKIDEEHKNWYATLIMLTNHTPFSAAETVDYEVNFKYEKIDETTGEVKEVVAPFLEGTAIGNYLKTVHYADEALGQLIEQMDEAGLLENTVVVIYGDHDAKVKRQEYLYYYNYDPYTDSVLSQDDPNYKDVDYYDYELNRKVPLIIWTKDHKVQGEVKKVMGMYDVVPTLANMFGFEQKYALGHDIFSTDENIVVFPDSSWITDTMYYSSSKGEGKVLNTEATINSDYIDKNNEYAEKIIKISNDIIIYDLIKRTKEDEEIIKEELNEK